MAVAAAVRERPILFSGRLMRAILEGRKTVTRRVVKPQPNAEGCPNAKMVDLGSAFGLLDGCLSGEWRCPYGVPGDRLWVRENWSAALSNARAFPGGSSRYESGWRWWHDVPAGMRSLENAFSVFYQADGLEVYTGTAPGEELPDLVRDWQVRASSAPRKPPRWLPSIHMPRWASRISLEVTEVRVERLHEITEDEVLAEGATWNVLMTPYERIRAFADLWNEINHPRGYGWGTNPWVWVIRFRRIES